MGFLKKMVDGTFWLTGKAVSGTTYAVGYTASAVADVVSDDKETGKSIREGTKKTAAALDSGTQVVGDYTGTGLEKTVEAIEKGTQMAVEVSRPVARVGLTAAHDKTKGDSVRGFKGFDPPLEHWSVAETDALLGIWKTKGTSLDKGGHAQENMKIALEHFGTNAFQLLATKGDIEYSNLVRGACKAVKVECDLQGLTTEQMEDELIGHVWKGIREKLTPEQLQQIEAAVREQHTHGGATAKAGGDVFAALTAAQLSGFGVYLAATTIVGILTHAVGVTLPFAFYTGMTSALNFVIGPEGFAIMAAVVLAGAARKNWDKIIPFIIYSRAIRENRQRQNSGLLQ